MTRRAIAAAVLLTAFAGCTTGGKSTGGEHPLDSPEESSSSIEEHELYWYQRGADATKAVWNKFRISADKSLIGEGGRVPSYSFATGAFNLLLDNVSTFWRKDLAAEAVAAYVGDFSAICPDRAANGRNDEVLLWATACARASRLTGNVKYLDEACRLYDALWLKQVDNAVGGGMWHRSDEKTSKSMSANMCAVIAAVHLYSDTQDMKYLLQARRLYKWASSQMFVPSTGAVYDSVSVDGTRSNFEYAGNAGAFIGASMRLYKATGSRAYLVNAKKAADRLVNSLESDKTELCPEKVGESLPDILAIRYLSELARRPGCEKYREFILVHARSAWTSRRLSDGLNGPDWTKAPAAGDEIEPWHAIAAAMLYHSASRACR
ncbi:MAG: hypothetical protein J5727_00370 [Kiritimatiellae bacterium]|nr:hypothetical protein [Kiritimatiellia bacterium]